MVEIKQRIQNNYNDIDEQELQAISGSVSENVMVTEAASSDHLAVSSLSHSSSMENEFNVDGTHSQLSKELSGLEIDTVTGGAGFFGGRPAYMRDTPRINSGAGEQRPSLLKRLLTKDNLRNTVVPPVGGAICAGFVGIYSGQYNAKKKLAAEKG